MIINKLSKTYSTNHDAALTYFPEANGEEIMRLRHLGMKDYRQQ